MQFRGSGVNLNNTEVKMWNKWTPPIKKTCTQIASLLWKTLPIMHNSFHAGWNFIFQILIYKSNHQGKTSVTRSLSERISYNMCHFMLWKRSSLRLSDFITARWKIISFFICCLLCYSFITKQCVCMEMKCMRTHLLFPLYTVA